ncbi:MAG: DNA gyrase inhibitor YacG [Spongiibacteraceae bacterium]
MKDAKKVLMVNCPSCKATTPWDSANPSRPFCSAQCKNQDFIAWANEENTIPGSPVYADMLSEDLLDKGM